MGTVTCAFVAMLGLACGCVWAQAGAPAGRPVGDKPKPAAAAASSAEATQRAEEAKREALEKFKQGALKQAIDRLHEERPAPHATNPLDWEKRHPWLKGMTEEECDRMIIQGASELVPSISTTTVIDCRAATIQGQIDKKEPWLRQRALDWKQAPPDARECESVALYAGSQPRFLIYQQQCEAALERQRQCERHIRTHLADEGWRLQALTADCYRTGDPERVVREYLDPDRAKAEQSGALDELARIQEERRRGAEEMLGPIRRKIEEERQLEELERAARRYQSPPPPPDGGQAPQGGVPMEGDGQPAAEAPNASRTGELLNQFLMGMAQGWAGARLGGGRAGPATTSGACAQVAQQVQEYQRALRQLDTRWDSHRQMQSVYQRGVAANTDWMRRNCR